MKSLRQLALFKGGHEKSGKSSKAGFGCHISDFIEKMAFLLEPHDNVRQKSSIGAVTVGAQRWVNTRCLRLPWTGMSGELRPRQLPEWRERFERCARAGRGCVRRVWWGEATVSKRFSRASAIGWTVLVKCRFTPRPRVHGLPGVAG